MTADAAPREIRLDDYVPYPFSFDEVRVARRRRRDERKKSCIRSIDESRRLTATHAQVTLDFALDDAYATVTATSRVTPIEGRDGSGGLVLNGKEPFFELAAAPRVDGERLPASAYVVEKDGDDTVMIIKSVPITTFTLEITTKFKPQENTELSGLYKSSGTFCAVRGGGFRSITYYPDRPDVMSVFTTKITADKTKYPVLLSNGNLVETETSADGTRSATWKDPWRKPCYLFALVAGDLAVVEDSFTTMSGREVALKIYAEHKNIDRCDFAMASLKRAMKWDEELLTWSTIWISSTSSPWMISTWAPWRINR